MTMTIPSTVTISLPSDLTDDELVAAIPRLAGDERHLTARLVAHLAEMDRRRLYLAAGHSSLYAYCREALGYSEDAAHNRKVVARVARRHPVILDMLADGWLGLTTVKLLAPVLSDSSCEAILREAAGGSKRDVERVVARLSPRPDVPSTVRKLPARAAAAAAAVPEQPAGRVAETGSAAPQEEEGGGHNAELPPKPEPPRTELAPKPQVPPAKRPEVKPLAPERYRVQFTIGEQTEKKLRRLQTLLRREIPSGDPAVLFDRGLDLLLAAVERKKLGKTTRRGSGEAQESTSSDAGKAARAPEASDETGRRPKPGSRHIPARTRRKVSLRDQEQCAFVAPDGRRCTERAFLEYHHGPIPFAHGGPPAPGNIMLYCRAHNAYEGKRIFGAFLPREIREARIVYDAMPFAVPERGNQ